MGMGMGMAASAAIDAATQQMQCGAGTNHWKSNPAWEYRCLQVVLPTRSAVGTWKCRGFHSGPVGGVGFRWARAPLG